MEEDALLENARRIEQDARKCGAVDVDELRDALTLVRDLAQVVVELAQRPTGVVSVGMD